MFSLAKFLFLAPLALACLAACSTAPTGGDEGDDETLEGELRVDEMIKGPGEAAGSSFIEPSPNAFQRGRPGLIRFIVIHDIEGPASAAINTFRNRNNEASSHYVVDGRGKVFQMVRERDIANHAFHSVMNAYAIGIEHEGYANGRTPRGAPAPYSDSLYDGSAKLVAELAKRYRIPLDRAHIIGHHQVPKSDDQALACAPDEQCGGNNGHHDPGPAWNWQSYMARVVREAQKLGYTNEQALPDSAFPLETIRPMAALTMTTANGSRPKLVGGFWATQCDTSDPNRQTTFRTIIKPSEAPRAETRYFQPTVGTCGEPVDGAFPIIFSGYTSAEISDVCLRYGNDVYKVAQTVGPCGLARPECLDRASCVDPAPDCIRSAARKLDPATAARECR